MAKTGVILMDDLRGAFSLWHDVAVSKLYHAHILQDGPQCDYLCGYIDALDFMASRIESIYEDSDGGER